MKLNDDQNHEYQKLNQTVFDLTNSLKGTRQQLEQKELLIIEQDMKLKLNSHIIANLEQERERLEKQLKEERALIKLSSETISNLHKQEDAELPKLRKEVQDLQSRNLQLENELKSALQNSGELQNELQQLKQRGYEREIWNLQKNLELSEIARGNLQDELANAHKKWHIFVDDLFNRTSTNQVRLSLSS